jgi:hypothetical protein
MEQFLNIFNQRVFQGIEHVDPEAAAKYVTTVKEDLSLHDATSIQVREALQQWVLSGEVDEELANFNMSKYALDHDVEDPKLPT